MDFVILLICYFLIQSVFSQSITAVPSTILIGLTNDLVVSCTYDIKNISNISSVISLVMFRWEISQFQELAAINSFNGITINVDADNFTVSGDVDAVGSSSLILTWNSSAAAWPAFYKCETNVLDTAGQPLTFTATLNITGVGQDSDLLVKEILKLRNYIEYQDREIQLCKEQVSTFMVTWTERLSAVQQTLFKKSTVYNGSQYFIYTEAPVSVPGVAQATCQVFGANMAEVGDGQEFDFVRDFIRNHSVSLDYKIHFVVIRGSQYGDAEHWVYPHSNTTVEYFSWAPDYPIENPDANCLSLWRYYDWNMTNIDCGRDQKNYPITYLCETVL